MACASRPELVRTRLSSYAPGGTDRANVNHESTGHTLNG